MDNKKPNLWVHTAKQLARARVSYTLCGNLKMDLYGDINVEKMYASLYEAYKHQLRSMTP